MGRVSWRAGGRAKLAGWRAGGQPERAGRRSGQASGRLGGSARTLEYSRVHAWAGLGQGSVDAPVEASLHMVRRSECIHRFRYALAADSVA